MILLPSRRPVPALTLTLPGGDILCRTDSGFSAASVFAWLGRRPARFHAHELQSEPAYQVEDAIQMGLIADLTDEGGVLGTGLQV